MTNQYLGVDPMLTNVAIAYSNDNLIADMVFPEFTVKKQSAKHFVYDRGRFRLNTTIRATASPSNEVTLNISTGTTYFCEDHALKQFVADEDVDNAVTPTSPFVDATENVADMLRIDRENTLQAIVRSTTVMTSNTTLSGTSQWSDYTNSDPFDDIETGMQSVHSAIGLNPNVFIIGKQVWDKLKHHPSFLERVKYSQKGVITTDLLASLIGVDKVLIGAAYYVNSKEGQTETTAYLWGKDAILAFVNPRIASKMITLGLTYTWKKMQTKRLRGTDEEDRNGTYVRVGNMYYDQQLVSAGAGYLIKTAVA